MTFDKHPREVLHSDYMPQMLSTLDEKVARIRATGVDRCEVLPFNEETASLSAFDFMRMVLKDRLGVEYLVIGYDNRFGHNRSEGFDDYVAFGKQIGIEVLCVARQGRWRSERGQTDGFPHGKHRPFVRPHHDSRTGSICHDSQCG